MLKIPLAVWIANAAACLTGTYGDVTHQAEAADCSRQTVSDQAQKVQAAVEAEHAGGPTHAELIPENEQLRQENARLWDWLAQTIEFPASKRHEFTVTATAMGLSLNQVLVLLALLLGAQARPGRSTIQRWIKAAGQRAAGVLKHLDRRCRTLVLVGCLDEIFFRHRPVLVGVEPASMVWFLGRKASDRQGATWCQELQGWTALQQGGGRRWYGITGRDRFGPPAAPRVRAGPAGEWPGRLPHRPGSSAGLEAVLEPRGTTLGAGRGRHASRRAGAAAGPRCAGRGRHGVLGLEEGGERLSSVRGSRRGLGAGADGVAVVSPRWPSERSSRGGAAGHVRAAQAVGTGLVQGPWVPPSEGDVHVLGPLAPPVASGRTG